MAIEVDLVVLIPSDIPLRPEVDAAIVMQSGVKLTVHRVIAAPRPEDVNRWATIARGRNEARRKGIAPYVMFLDDDVVLGENCVATLVERLLQRPAFGALAADYLGESRSVPVTHHVAMGATLFRRAALQQISFRWEPDKCECQCCCDDLRALYVAIAYEPRAVARHLAGYRQKWSPLPHGTGSGGGSQAVVPGRILAAFDRNHFRLFRRQFLASLRSAGNDEWVTAVVYGLYPSERQALLLEPRVEVVALPPHENPPARRRLWDFQPVVARFSPQTPVAYWDAGDVVFQASLKPLWDQVRAHRDKLLAVGEPIPFESNTTVKEWASSIWDPNARREALELFRHRPNLNSGFAAGMAPALLDYLHDAATLWNSPALAGSSDWGDQTAFNLYCHTHPQRWLEVEEGWNYCLKGRGRREAFWRQDGRVISRHGTPVHVVHGNAKTLPDLLTEQSRY